jgi:hypothetical protein
MILGAFGGLGMVAEEIGAAGGGGGGGAVAEDPLKKLATLASLKPLEKPLEKQAAVGGEFTMGKAPPVRPVFRKDFQVAFQQFQSSKHKTTKDYHQKVVRILRKKFPGDLEAQLDYLEENGFAEFNPTTTCIQITTREQATQKIQQINKRIQAIDDQARDYMRRNPGMVTAANAGRHRGDAQRKIERLVRQTDGEFTEEQQAIYDSLVREREEEKQKYKINKLLLKQNGSLQKTTGAAAEGGGGSLLKATGAAAERGGLARPPSPLGKQAEGGGLARRPSPLGKQAEGGGDSEEDPHRFDEAWYMSSDDDL